jgi:hypothetical protein
MSQRDLDDWITGYLKFTDNTEPSKLYREWVAASTVAAALERKCKLEWGHYTFYPNMYVILVGPSGARKGTAMKPARRIMSEIGIKTISESITKEALANRINDAEQLANPNEEQEGLQSGTFHSSVTIYNEEISVLFKENDFDLIMWLTDWYDCPEEPWTYETKTQGTTEIVNPWVNMIGAMTPDLVKKSLPGIAIGGGFTARTIFVFSPGREKVVPLPFTSEDEEQTREKLIHDLEHIHSLKGKFTYSREFIDLYQDWYIETVEDPPFNDPKLDGYLNRRQPHLLRLCMIMSASQRSDMKLNSEVFERAKDMLERTEKMMPRVFSGVGEGENTQIMSEVIAYLSDKEEITKKEILERFYKEVDNERHLETILGTMSAMDLIKRKKTANGTIVEVNRKSEMSGVFDAANAEIVETIKNATHG